MQKKKSVTKAFHNSLTYPHLRPLKEWLLNFVTEKTLEFREILQWFYNWFEFLFLIIIFISVKIYNLQQSHNVHLN